MSSNSLDRSSSIASAIINELPDRNAERKKKLVQKLKKGLPKLPKVMKKALRKNKEKPVQLSSITGEDIDEEEDEEEVSDDNQRQTEMRGRADSFLNAPPSSESDGNLKSNMNSGFKTWSKSRTRKFRRRQGKYLILNSVKGNSFSKSQQEVDIETPSSESESEKHEATVSVSFHSELENKIEVIEPIIQKKDKPSILYYIFCCCPKKSQTPVEPITEILLKPAEQKIDYGATSNSRSIDISTPTNTTARIEEEEELF